MRRSPTRPPHVVPLMRGRAIRALGVLVALAATACSDGPSITLPPPPDPAAVADVLDDEGRGRVRAATDAVVAAPGEVALWRALGKTYETNDLPAQAEAAYAIALLLDPEDARTLYRAAITARKAGNGAAAFDYLDRTIDLEPGYGPAWRRRGLWKLEEGDVDAARRSFDRTAELLPDAADAPLCLARAALLADDVTEALRQTTVARERAPKDPYVRLMHGTALRRAGRVDEAEDHLVAGQGATPTFIDPWTAELRRGAESDEAIAARAQRLEGERKWGEAIAIYRELLRKRPDDSGVIQRLGVCLRADGRAAEAVTVLEAGLERFPGHHDISMALTGALQAAGRSSEALAAANEIIERWDDRPAGYLARGAIRRDAGDVSGALSDFSRASDLAPTDPRGRMFQGQVLLQQKRWADAERVLESGLDRPGAAPPLSYFGMLLQAKARRGANGAEISATLDRARAVHGDAADSLVRTRR